MVVNHLSARHGAFSFPTSEMLVTFPQPFSSPLLAFLYTFRRCLSPVMSTPGAVCAAGEIRLSVNSYFYALRTIAWLVLRTRERSSQTHEEVADEASTETTERPSFSFGIGQVVEGEGLPHFTREGTADFGMQSGSVHRLLSV